MKKEEKELFIKWVKKQPIHVLAVRDVLSQKIYIAKPTKELYELFKESLIKCKDKT